MTITELCAILTAAIISISAIAALVGWLLRIRAEVSNIAARVAAIESNCISRKEWLLTIARTLQSVDKNQTKLAAMLGVEIDGGKQ